VGVGAVGKFIDRDAVRSAEYAKIWPLIPASEESANDTLKATKLQVLSERTATGKDVYPQPPEIKVTDEMDPPETV